MNQYFKKAEELHKKVPPNWYFQSLKIDLLQRFWHKTRFNEVEKVLEITKGVILDVGSADGVFTHFILEKTKARKIVGIDVLRPSVEWARKHWKDKRMEFKVGDAHELNFKNESFDAVFCLEVLEHVHNPKRVLKEFRRVLKRGGYGVFLVPSDSLLFRVIWWLWLHFYPRGWVWRDTHIQTYRNNYLTKICKEAGFKIEIDKKFNLGMLHLIKVRKD